MSTEVKILAGMGVFSAIVIGTVIAMSGNSNQPVEAKERLVRENSIQTGPKTAKVTLVEFGDYQCPACRTAAPIIDQILIEFPNQINFVFRHFPISGHQNARSAARAAEAAGEQGKYWPMHSRIYEGQNEWATLSNPIDVYNRYATEIGLDSIRFQQDIKSGKYDEKITDDQGDGIALGVNSTPTFFFNGEKLQGVPKYSELKEKVEQALNQ